MGISKVFLVVVAFLASACARINFVTSTATSVHSASEASSCKALATPGLGGPTDGAYECSEFSPAEAGELPSSIRPNKQTYLAGEKVILTIKHSRTGLGFGDLLLWITPGEEAGSNISDYVPRAESGKICVDLGGSLPPGDYVVRVLYGQPDTKGFLPCKIIPGSEFTVN